MKCAVIAHLKSLVGATELKYTYNADWWKRNVMGVIHAGVLAAPSNKTVLMTGSQDVVAFVLLITYGTLSLQQLVFACYLGPVNEVAAPMLWHALQAQVVVQWGVLTTQLKPG